MAPHTPTASPRHPGISISKRYSHARTLFSGVVAIVVAAVLFGVTGNMARALEPDKTEKAKLLECEADICGLVLNKTPETGRLTCRIGKTWAKRDIKKGAKSTKVKWLNGDAKCEVKFQVNRADVVNALIAKKFELKFLRHHVNCVVENGSGVDKVRVSLAPRMKFSNGQVRKVWINIKEVDAPPGISSLVWTVAKLQDNLGVFHDQAVEEINDFLHKKCRKRHGNK